MSVWAIIVLLAAVVAAAGVALRFGWKRAAGGGTPYARRSRLLSPAARQFLHVLDEAAGSDFRVFAKVAASDVLRVVRPPETDGYRRALARLQRHDFPFVVCERSSMQIACVVELDERSHHQHNRGRGEPFLTEACRIAGLPLLRVIARRDYDIADLRQRVDEAIVAGRRHAPVMLAPTPASSEPSTEASAVDAPQKQARSDTRGSVLTPALMASITHSERSDEVGAPSCPRCGAVMVRRHVHIGRHPGGDFWSCIHFPNCRGVVPIIGRAASFGP